MFPYADTHSDTLTELYLGGYDIKDAPLHISLDKAAKFSPYVQVGAVWTDNTLSDDEAYDRFFRVLRAFEESPSVKAGRARIVRTVSELDSAVAAGVPAFMLAVEGARILAGRDERFDAVADTGVRLMTLEWKHADCIGGAWNTDAPLTDFGRTLLRKLRSRGMAADVSHANGTVTDEVLDFAEENGLAVCASHSNSYAVFPHGRNLTDERFCRIAALGGIVGISMAPEHLAGVGSSGLDDIYRHVSHYLDLGGDGTVCLGCDFDGITTTPEGVGNVSCIPALREYLEGRGIPSSVLDKLFFTNAYGFIRSILGHDEFDNN